MAEMTGGQVFKMLENKKDLGSTKSEKYARVLERMPQEHLLLCFSLRAMLIFTWKPILKCQHANCLGIINERNKGAISKWNTQFLN